VFGKTILEKEKNSKSKDPFYLRKVLDEFEGERMKNEP